MPKPQANALRQAEPRPFWRMLLESRRYFVLITLGGLRSADVLLLSLSPHYRRLADLRRHRQELARPRRLRPEPRRRARSPRGFACRDTRLFLPPASCCLDASTTTPSCWCRSSSMWFAVSSSPTWRGGPCLTGRRALRISAGGVLSLHRQLHGRAVGRNAQHLLRCAALDSAVAGFAA